MLVVALGVLLWANSANVEFRPIVLLVVAIDSEVLFQSLISLFGFPLPSGWFQSEVKLHVQCSSEGLEEWDMNSVLWWKWCGLDTVLGKCVEWRVVQVEWCDGIVSSGWRVTALRDDQQWLESGVTRRWRSSLMKIHVMTSKALGNQKLLEKL